MEFCPECGAMLLPQNDKLECKCGYKKDLTKSESTQYEVSEKVEVLRKGSEKTGYVTLTKDWEIVHRQEGEVEVIIFENSKKKEEYITLMQNTTDIYDINSMALSAYEKLTRNEEDAKYVKKLKESTLNGK